jgi:hypothetical protein
VYTGFQAPRGPVDRDTAMIRCRVGLKDIKVALKDEYKGG